LLKVALKLTKQWNKYFMNKMYTSWV
jgi:hypothetical protein